MSEVLVRLWIGLTIHIITAVVRLVLLVVRLAVRHPSLVGLAATVAGVRWAAATVGAGPAVRLALIGWAAWATRHHRAAIRQHAAVRRLATAQQAAARKLTAALQQHTDALAAAAKTLPRRPGSSPTTTTADRDVLAVPPWHSADQPVGRAVAALGRYAEAWARRHAAPAPKEPR
jgi:hypothetical protein